MTYRFECGGQKFFRNRIANVGSTALCNNADPSNACRCGSTQNSHAKLLDIFGPGQSIVAPPTVSITAPAEGAVLGNAIGASAGSKRGVDRVELWLNGWKWATVPGIAFGPQGQPNPAPYAIAVPQDIPDGNYDVVVKAYDDLGTMTESEVVHATRGAPCASADSCLEGQKCEEGKCFWDPPTREVGDSCDFDQACVSGMCVGNSDGKVCSQPCVVGSENACPEDSGLVCVEAGDGGVCFVAESGGCCNTTDRPGNVAGRLALSLGVFGLILIRRRRSR